MASIMEHLQGRGQMDRPAAASWLLGLDPAPPLRSGTMRIVPSGAISTMRRPGATCSAARKARATSHCVNEAARRLMRPVPASSAKPLVEEWSSYPCYPCHFQG